ncbi:MAG TPA: SusC/RagA family TonB-linked outer membrane protein [Cyclobacteriaceae bacterium]|nr:SusC/RagA family TonB-linked outer membrane protein [Cyclobacteriaceae bacterium]
MKKILLCAVVFISCLQELQAQQRTVTGKVTAEDDGSTLPGVNVVVKGTANGTVTDANGNYTISFSESNPILVFSFVGMTTKEVAAGANATLDVQLAMDVTQLNEVVVNAMGDVVPKDRLGSAPANVGGAAIKSSGETGILNGLAGKAPGLNITRNGGDPGAGSYIQIRGQSTINGSIQPLIVIDGMPMFNTFQDSGNGNQVDGVQQQSRLNDINPEDIASVQLISSAAAAALWGSRAANGVIMITTKKGTNTKGKLNITYAGTLSFDQVNKVPELQRTFGQGTDGAYVYNTPRSWGDKISERSGGQDTYITSGAGYTGYTQFADGSRRYRISQKNSKETYDHGTEAFQTGHYLDNNISLSGGNERSNIFASYSNLNQEGIVQNNSDYKRNTARVNASTMLTDKIQLLANMTYSGIKSNRIQQGSNLGGIFLGGLRTPPDFDNSWAEGTYYNPDGIATPNKQVTFRNTNGSASNSGFDNPMWTINHNRNTSNVARVLGNIELNYDIASWLSLKGNAGVDTYTDRQTEFINAQSAILPGGAYTEQTISESQFNTNLYATGKKRFSDKFGGTLVLGFNYNSRQFNQVGAQGIGFIVPDAPANFNNTDPGNRVPFNLASTIKTAASFADLNVDFANQLFINVTGRAESSSTFGPEASSMFFYPSASVAWQFTQLMANKNLLNFGKLRASYGVVGRQPDPYLNLTTYGPTSFVESWGGTLAGGQYNGGYSIATTVGNPVIRPERKHELEGGFDLRFWNDRVTFSATAFYNKTTDVILPVNVSPSTGFATKVANAAEMENKGLEFVLEPTWVKSSSGFTWSSTFMWSNYRNKVLSLSGAESVFLSGGGFSDGSSRAVEGQPLGVLWGTYYDQKEDGSYVLDENGFPKLAPGEGVIGNPNPQYRMSIGNTLSFKGVTLYALFDMQAGGQMWNGTRGALVNYGTAKSTETETTVSAADAAAIKTFDGSTIADAGRATQNGDGTYTFRGTVGDYGGGKVALDQAWYLATGGGFNVNGPFVEKANWSRLREVTLSYSFNGPGFRSATKLQGITIGVTGRNLALWTPYSGIDPETNLTGAQNGRGIDYFQNPNTKSILFKLTITY